MTPAVLAMPRLDVASLLPGAAREFERLRARDVQRSGLLTTGSEERFDRLTRAAARGFDTPFATLSLITGDRQYLRSMVGPFERDGSREAAFCNLTIRSEDGLVIPDTLDHPQFGTSSFVLGAPGLRFYAGTPLRGPSGWFVGSLCVMDTKPRTFSGADVRALRRLADTAELELNGGL